MEQELGHQLRAAQLVSWVVARGLHDKVLVVGVAAKVAFVRS